MDLRRWSRRVVAVVKEAAGEFGNDKAGRMAAAIAFRAVFSLTPILFLALSIAGFFFRDEQVLDELSAQAAQVLGPQVGETLRRVLDSVGDSATATGVVGVALLVWTGSSLFLEVQSSLNDIFGMPQDAPTGIMGVVYKRLIGFAGVVAVGLVVLTLLAANSALGFLGALLAELGLERLEPVIGFGTPLVSLVLLVVVLAVQFKTFTAREVPWRAALRGGLITALLFVVGGLALGLYLTTREEVTAGVFTGTLVLILFLVSILAMVYLFGAEVTKVLTDELSRPPGEQVEEPREPEPAARWAPPSLGLTALVFAVGFVLGRRAGS